MENHIPREWYSFDTKGTKPVKIYKKKLHICIINCFTFVSYTIRRKKVLKISANQFLWEQMADHINHRGNYVFIRIWQIGYFLSLRLCLLNNSYGMGIYLSKSLFLEILVLLYFHNLIKAGHPSLSKHCTWGDSLQHWIPSFQLT